MQLDSPPRAPSIRDRLRLAACLLLAAASPAAAPAADATPVHQLDLTSLLYGETKRVDVLEPTGRYSCTYADGQSYYLQFGVDAITGSSPTGASPSGQAQTFTSASGHTTTRAGDEIPLAKFHDVRTGFDGGWVKPFGIWTSTLTGHYSKEKDYESVGGSARLAVDLNQRLTTVSFGAGVNHDSVFPVGGITAGLADPNTILASSSDPKRVASYLLGVSQVLSRRWLVSVTGSRISESGYLTEPYKTVSLIDPATGFSTTVLTEKRPETRARTSVLLSSVYHFTNDVLSASYRWYTDSWNLGAHTLDLRYRHDVTENVWLEPHLRYYTQSAADFFTPQLASGAPLPDFATADIRLGKLQTVTAGATLGLRLDPSSGEWRFRVEYVGFMGDHHPGGAIGIQRSFDLYPTVNTATVVVDYTLKFWRRRDVRTSRVEDYRVGRFRAMASPCEILVDTEDPVLADRALRLAEEEAARVEAKFSRYLPGNIVHLINNALGRAVEVDDETALLIEYAASVHEMSSGLFDVTSGVLRRVWKFDGGDHVPSQPEVQDVLKLVGWHRVSWWRPSFTMPPGMEIDLGGIGKEYAVDRAASLISRVCDAAFLVNFGGDLFASGRRRGGRPWRVGVDDPSKTGEAALHHIDLLAGGLATSGDARRYVMWKGVRLGHILNPKTGWPVEGAPRSVTVMAATCVEAGTLSTLAYLQGPQAREFLSRQAVACWVV